MTLESMEMAQPQPACVICGADHLERERHQLPFLSIRYKPDNNGTENRKIVGVMAQVESRAGPHQSE